MVGRFLRGLDLISAVHAVLVTSSGFRGIQASLETVREVESVRATEMPYLNEILAFGLGDKGLQLRGREGVD